MRHRDPRVLADWRRRLATMPTITNRPAVDDTNIALASVSIGTVACRAAPPLRFRARYDPDDELYDLDSDFGISLSAHSRPELLRELDEALSMLWTEYTQEQPDRLSPKARDLRTELRRRLRSA